MNRLNPIYLISLACIITFIFLFNMNIKENQLKKSNSEVTNFQKKFNEYIYLKHNTLSKNEAIEKIKSLIENELPNNININVKTLKNSVDIKLETRKKSQKLAFEIIELFTKNSLIIEYISAKPEVIEIKVKI